MQMADHNIGSLVVLKPGEQQHIAGIITERGKAFTATRCYKKKAPQSHTWFTDQKKEKKKINDGINCIMFKHVTSSGDLTDYLRKIIGQGRSKYTRVGEIMTDEVISSNICTVFLLTLQFTNLSSKPTLNWYLSQNKLITVTSDTNILRAMQLMTGNQHINMHVIIHYYGIKVIFISNSAITNGYSNDHRQSHTACSSHWWKNSGHDFDCRCCSCSGGTTNWGTKAIAWFHQRRILLDCIKEQLHVDSRKVYLSTTKLKCTTQQLRNWLNKSW